MSKILLIGKNSYLAQEFKNIDNFHYISRYNENINLKQYSHIINFSIQKEFNREILNTNDLIDSNIIGNIDKNQIYIMLSSRKVYKSIKDKINVFKEDSERNIDSIDPYTINKIHAEDIVSKHRNSLILRIGNVIGPLKNINNENTFIGWIKHQIDCKKIDLTQDCKTVKDFITLTYFKNCVLQLIEKNATGIFNVGSNIMIQYKDLLDYINIDKNVLATDKYDQFILNTQKLLSVVNIKLDREEILSYWKGAINEYINN